MIRLFCLIALIGASAAFAGDAVSANPPVKKTAGPLPHSIQLGNTFESFVASHPEARPADSDRRSEPIDPQVPESLVLQYEADPAYGLLMFADFGFREGRLYEFVAVWKSLPENIRASRTAFWHDCLTQHGTDYERCLLPVFVKEGEERLVPAACWRTPMSLTLAYCVDQKDETAPGKSMLVYAQFPPDDPTLARNLAVADPSQADHASLWRDMDALIRGETASAE